MTRGDDLRPGINTNRRTRPLMINKLNDYLKEISIENSEYPIIINSKRTTDEMWTFVVLNNRAEALKGYHDDLILALSIAL